MINGITSSSPHLFAAGATTLPYVNTNPGIPLQGALRINGSQLECYDAGTWSLINMSIATVGLNGAANSAINWAIDRMQEEKAWESLAKENQAVKIALENLGQARRQLDITAKLARNYETTS